MFGVGSSKIMYIQNKKGFLLLLVVLVVLALVADSFTEVPYVEKGTLVEGDSRRRRPKASKAEFEALAAAIDPKYKTTLPWARASASVARLPKYLKYDETKLTRISDQGICASCWSIGVTGILADRISIYTNGAIKEELSDQEMVSCWRGHKGDGCRIGGIPELAYNYIIKNGIALEKDYPYEQEFTKKITKCNKPKMGGKRVFAQAGSAKSLCIDPDQFPEGSDKWRQTVNANIDNMKREIFLRGPIVGTLMIHESTYKYQGLEVYKGPKNKGDKFIGGHVLQLVGWSDSANTDEPGFEKKYWICKQSWGLEYPSHSIMSKGYMFVEMGRNVSGIESRASACMPVITPEISAKMVDSLDHSRFLSYEQYKNSPGRKNFIKKTTRLGRAFKGLTHK